MARRAAEVPSDIVGEGSRRSVDIRPPPDRRHPDVRKWPSAVPPAGDSHPTSGTPPRSGKRSPRCSCIAGAPRTALPCRDTARPIPIGCRRSCWCPRRGPTTNPPGRVSRVRDETRPKTEESKFIIHVQYHDVHTCVSNYFKYVYYYPDAYSIYSPIHNTYLGAYLSLCVYRARGSFYPRVSAGITDISGISHDNYADFINY